MTPGVPEVIGIAVLFLSGVVVVLTAGVRQDARVNRQIRAEWVAWLRAGRPARMSTPASGGLTHQDGPATGPIAVRPKVDPDGNPIPPTGDVEDRGDQGVAGVAA